MTRAKKKKGKELLNVSKKCKHCKLSYPSDKVYYDDVDSTYICVYCYEELATGGY